MSETAAQEAPAPKALSFRIAPLEKADPTQQFAVVANAFEPEDEYHAYYVGGAKSVQAIMPPYNLRTLDRLTQENNALSPCIEAMVNNVAGTGFTLVKDAPGAEEPDGDNKDPKVLEMWSFFEQPWPGESFVTQRKALWRDVKRIGNGYLEVIRDGFKEIVFTRNVDGKMIRLVKLTAAIDTPVKVMRKGKEVTVNLKQRYRRFVQLINGREVLYFKEFGCPLDLDKHTGEWGTAQKPVELQDRASELMHFIDLPDAHTPYGVPQWISQLPSVLGSRKAEEFNVEFFDNGGVPPVLIILQGGVLSTESRKAFEQRVMGPAARKQRVNVVEMEPTGGSLDSPAQAKVLVERFGAERQNDSMFEKYDERCEIRIRRAFRLPPIFVGQAEDYSFATAFASYTVAEAQVFRPERQAFDELISSKFLPALGYKGYLLKSNPLSIEDATLKLQGITLGLATGAVENSELVDAINETVGTRLKVSKTAPKLPPTSIPPQQGKDAQGAAPGAPKGTSRNGKAVDKGPKATPRKSPTVTKSDTTGYSVVMSALSAIATQDPEALRAALDEMKALSPEEAEELLTEIILD